MCENHVQMLKNANASGGIQNYVFFSPNELFQLCYTHVLKEVMEILHLYIKIKSKVGVNFDVPHDVPLRGI